MKKTMWVALVLALLLTGCGSKEAVREVPAPSVQKTETAPAAPVAQESPAAEETTLEAFQVEADARVPLEEEILGDYNRAVRIYAWFELTPLADDGTTIVEDGDVYRHVSSAEVQTLEELRMNLRSVFSEELTQRLLSGQEDGIRFREFDGDLYVTGSGREREPGKGTVFTEVEQTGENTYCVNVTVDLVDETDGVVTGMECWSFPYGLEDGRWGFTEFRLVY